MDKPQKTPRLKPAKMESGLIRFKKSRKFRCKKATKTTDEIKYNHEKDLIKS
jgi:hypothetical protein